MNNSTQPIIDTDNPLTGEFTPRKGTVRDWVSFYAHLYQWAWGASRRGLSGATVPFNPFLRPLSLLVSRRYKKTFAMMANEPDPQRRLENLERYFGSMTQSIVLWCLEHQYYLGFPSRGDFLRAARAYPPHAARLTALFTPFGGVR